MGPVCAAIFLTAWSHPGRFRPEAALAILGGVAPIPASSGNTIRHRLSKQGHGNWIARSTWSLELA